MYARVGRHSLPQGRGQCLDRRIGDRARLEAEIAAWVHQRNEARARIRWMFTTAVARKKMGKAYPAPAAPPPSGPPGHLPLRGRKCDSGLTRETMDFEPVKSTVSRY
jgi:hypothetical protein